jgi:hypothetical protein
MGPDRHSVDTASRRRNAAIALATLGAPFAVATPAGADEGEGTKPPPPAPVSTPQTSPASHGNRAAGAAVQDGETPGESGSAGGAGSTGVRSSGSTRAAESTSAEGNGFAGRHASTGANGDGAARTHTRRAA